MALEAGVICVTVEYGKDLKDRDWFGKQDPYVIVKCGGQTFRSRTATDGGRNPVWNETFRFNIINENTAELKLMDEDTLTRDDVIGDCVVSLARAREQGHDNLQVPVLSSRSRKQRGFVSVRLTYETNKSMKPHQHQHQYQYAPQPQYVMGPPAPVAYAPYPAPQYAPSAYPAPYPIAAPQPYLYAPYGAVAPHYVPAAYPVHATGAHAYPTRA